MTLSNTHENKRAGQGAGANWVVELSYSDDGTTVTANQRFDVEGYAFIRVYNTSGGATTVSVSHSKSVTPLPLVDRAGVAISVADDTSQLVEVRGAKVASVSTAAVVQLVA